MWPEKNQKYVRSSVRPDVLTGKSERLLRHPAVRSNSLV
nr:unnamed protein product [Callosobruchus chinensis]CAH7744050.1 unnamed protein product [Callosobruchus chinensis]